MLKCADLTGCPVGLILRHVGYGLLLFFRNGIGSKNVVDVLFLPPGAFAGLDVVGVEGVGDALVGIFFDSEVLHGFYYFLLGFVFRRVVGLLTVNDFCFPAVGELACAFGIFPFVLLGGSNSPLGDVAHDCSLFLSVSFQKKFDRITGKTGLKIFDHKRRRRHKLVFICQRSAISLQQMIKANGCKERYDVLFCKPIC